VAQFGRGIMEDVSRHLVGQAAECIQSKLEAPPPSTAAADLPEAGAGASSAPPAPPQSSPAASEPPALDAMALGRAVAKERLSRIKVRPQTIAMGFAGLVSLLLFRRVRRARRRRREQSG
jgi:hypothetical protein